MSKPLNTKDTFNLLIRGGALASLLVIFFYPPWFVEVQGIIAGCGFSYLLNPAPKNYGQICRIDASVWLAELVFVVAGFAITYLRPTRKQP